MIGYTIIFIKNFVQKNSRLKSISHDMLSFKKSAPKLLRVVRGCVRIK